MTTMETTTNYVSTKNIAKGLLYSILAVFLLYLALYPGVISMSEEIHESAFVVGTCLIFGLWVLFIKCFRDNLGIWSPKLDSITKKYFFEKKYASKKWQLMMFAMFIYLPLSKYLGELNILIPSLLFGAFFAFVMIKAFTMPS